MQLNQFLIKAKINTYAADGYAPEKKLADGSKELVYKKEDYRYRDRYFGFDPFLGEEIVWHKNKKIWGMNYYGRVTSDIIAPKEIYRFLKKAMARVTEDRPFRGPGSFKEENLEYEDKSQGDINDFCGQETIRYKNKKVYKLYYHGGKII